MLLSFPGYLGEIESENKNTLEFSHSFFLHVSVVSGSALPIFMSQLVTAVVLELSETLSIFWPAQLVHL